MVVVVEFLFCFFSFPKTQALASSVVVVVVVNERNLTLLS